jgi:iron complex outermembrane recepter protein
MRKLLWLLSSAAAIPVSAVAQTVTPPDPVPETQDSSEIVVTGVRDSLERAAEVKRDAIQVVDSIVAQDIGKLPDPTTAAALQRVPGIQVSVSRTNELGDVRVRGLPDVLTTVDGREVFTTTGRRLDLQDVPAEALGRIDVFKSQTPDLIEGGLAGVIDLRLNKPFNFRKPTIVLTARGNYGLRSEKFSPQFGALATNRWDTGIGEIGVLVNGTWSRNDYQRDQTILSGLRSTAATPLNTAGYLIPNILQNFPEEGRIDRTQANAAIQWQASPSLELYVDGLYTRSHDRGAHYGANVQPFTTNVTLTNVQASDNCFQARATAAGQNPTIQTDSAGNRTLQPFTVQNLCYLNSGTLNNVVVNQTTQARDIVQENKLIAGGLRFDQAGWKANLDLSYQTSRSDRTLIIADIGQRLPA